MPYSFPHDGRVYLATDDKLEVAYYSLGLRKYRRIRDVMTQLWEDTTEQEIDADTFWMVVACLERKR